MGNYMKPMADFIREKEGFGFVATTWNCLYAEGLILVQFSSSNRR